MYSGGFYFRPCSRNVRGIYVGRNKAETGFPLVNALEGTAQLIEDVAGPLRARLGHDLVGARLAV